jgi:hypothetical protein
LPEIAELPLGALDRGVRVTIPKGLNHSAQYPCPKRDNNPERVASIPHMPLIVGDLIPLEKRPIFVLKGCLSMMLLLAGDVLLCIRDLRISDRKDSKPLLPAEVLQTRILGLDPER